MSIEKGLDNIKTALDTTKMLKSTQEQMDKAEVNMKLVELMEVLVTAKAEFVDIKSEMVDKDKLIMELQSQLEKKASVVFEDPFLWKITDGEKEGTPYCHKCYHTDKELIPLHSKDSTNGSHKCPVCDKWYGKGRSYTPRRRTISKGSWRV